MTRIKATCGCSHGKPSEELERCRLTEAINEDKPCPHQQLCSQPQPDPIQEHQVPTPPESWERKSKCAAKVIAVKSNTGNHFKGNQTKLAPADQVNPSTTGDIPYVKVATTPPAEVDQHIPSQDLSRSAVLDHMANLSLQSYSPPPEEVAAISNAPPPSQPTSGPVQVNSSTANPFHVVLTAFIDEATAERGNGLRVSLHNAYDQIVAKLERELRVDLSSANYEDMTRLRAAIVSDLSTIIHQLKVKRESTDQVNPSTTNDENMTKLSIAVAVVLRIVADQIKTEYENTDQVNPSTTDDEKMRMLSVVENFLLQNIITDQLEAERENTDQVNPSTANDEDTTELLKAARDFKTTAEEFVTKRTQFKPV